MNMLPPTDPTVKITNLEKELALLHKELNTANMQACDKEVECAELTRKLNTVNLTHCEDVKKLKSNNASNNTNYLAKIDTLTT